jgi:hypothetical protein
MNKSIKELFSASKLYNKYLLTVRIKLNNSNMNEIEHIKNFKEFSETADQVYEEIKNEWFYLSNNDNIKLFRLKNDSIETHKTNFYENYYALESIAKLYGFDNWYTNAKYKLSSSSSPNSMSNMESNTNLINNI